MVRPVRPVRARDAASLILLRSGGTEVEVLMGRRASGHRFLPGVYVFPGGRVDAEDYVAPSHSVLREDVQARVALSGGEARARALGMTALRETWEETGLALGEVRNSCLLPELHRLDYLARAITPPASPIRFHARFFVACICGNEGELGGSGELLDLGWRPLAECLRMPVADVTEFVLAQIAAYIGKGTRPDSLDVPLFCYRNGKARVRG
jgi:8-oxo-dGTP pyrophosphatase MutT (NUDIX family)